MSVCPAGLVVGCKGRRTTHGDAPRSDARSAKTHTHTHATPDKTQSVTETEAQRWDEVREAREARKAEFRDFLVEHYRKRGEEPPPSLRDDAGAGAGAGGAQAAAAAKQ